MKSTDCDVEVKSFFETQSQNLPLNTHGTAFGKSSVGCAVVFDFVFEQSVSSRQLREPFEYISKARRQI